MKKVALKLMTLAMILTLFTACKKDNSNKPDEVKCEDFFTQYPEVDAYFKVSSVTNDYTGTFANGSKKKITITTAGVAKIQTVGDSFFTFDKSMAQDCSIDDESDRVMSIDLKDEANNRRLSLKVGEGGVITAIIYEVGTTKQATLKYDPLNPVAP